MKRAFDIVTSGLGLVLLAPLLASIACVIRLDSRGPAFFRQPRVGLRGRTFRIYKFRTMRMDADRRGPEITVGNDPRVTRAGAVLRRWKLDELPQLINVLVGDMSLVGPRPEVPSYVELWDDRTRDVILSVRPGITDPASIEFRNESELLAGAADPVRTYVEVIVPRKNRLAVAYVESASLWTDLKILFRTLYVVVH